MEPTQLSVEAVLRRHGEILEQHRQFLASFFDAAGPSPAAGEVARVCSEQMSSMLETFTNCQTAFGQAFPTSLSRPPQPSGVQLPSSSALHLNGHSQVDPSGFFMADTQPTPVEELLRASQNGSTAVSSPGKRRGSVDHHHDPPNGKKRLRHSGGRGNSLGQRVSDGFGASEGQSAEHIDPDDDSFVREVEQLLTTKEQKQRLLEERKRKRESGGSANLEHSSRPAAHQDRPSKKRRTAGNRWGQSISGSTTSSNSHREQVNNKKRKGSSVGYKGGAFRQKNQRGAKRQRT